jgi:hypothetical protein
MRGWIGACVLAGTLPLAACNTSGTNGPTSAAPEPLPAAPSGRVGVAGLAPVEGRSDQSAKPPEMAGRWVLAAAAGTSCVMTFGSAPAASEGSIAPEGGCPGDFFTSRRWAFVRGALVIRDHKDVPLAQLTAAGAGRFEGRATGGTGVSLTSEQRAGDAPTARQ